MDWQKRLQQNESASKLKRLLSFCSDLTKFAKLFRKSAATAKPRPARPRLQASQACARRHPAVRRHAAASASSRRLADICPPRHGKPRPPPGSAGAGLLLRRGRLPAGSYQGAISSQPAGLNACCDAEPGATHRRAPRPAPSGKGGSGAEWEKRRTDGNGSTPVRKILRARSSEGGAQSRRQVRLAAEAAGLS